VLARYRPNANVRATAFRRDELIERCACVPRPGIRMRSGSSRAAGRAQMRLLEGWLAR
jgi:hypothetical protein